MSFIKYFFHFTEGIIDLPINTNPPLQTDEPISVVQDVVYNKSLPDICLLDVFFIPNRKRYPVLFYIHGGGFVAGDRYKRRGIAKWYASLGFFVVNVDYGLCPEFSYPEPVRHLTDALNWIDDNAEDYQLDVEKIVVAGDSAGAYYAALLAALTSNPRLATALDAQPRVKISAAILNCGLYDIEAALNQKIIFSVNTQIFESFTGVKDEDFETYKYRKECSPLNYVTSAYPPSFILYAKKDLFCAGQSERMIEALQNAHVYCEEFHSNDLFNNHCFSLQWLNRKAQQANASVSSFLQDFLGGRLAERERRLTEENRYIEPDQADEEIKESASLSPPQKSERKIQRVRERASDRGVKKLKPATGRTKSDECVRIPQREIKKLRATEKEDETTNN